LERGSELELECHFGAETDYKLRVSGGVSLRLDEPLDDGLDEEPWCDVCHVVYFDEIF
jgi:hypothetical protein